MRALLDVNVLIALLDAEHVSHATATRWFAAHARDGWASCPLTQNGCVRVMSSRGYPNALPVHVVSQRLAEACATKFHRFWPADISWIDTARFDTSYAHGPAQLTDLYLLGLAVRHGGRLVTFDQRISTRAVPGATPQHLLTL